MSVFKKMSLFFKAMEDFNRFFDSANQDSRKLVFYSEKGIYLRYYQSLIEQILKDSDLEICYLTADENDPIFQMDNQRIKSFYVRNFEASLFPRLDSKVVVMTLPDLNQFYIKKTTNNVNHVYVFHAIGSTHLQYNFGAFNHYDTIFCVGPHHEAEIRKTESLYNLKPKSLIAYGYPYLEQVYGDHQTYLNSQAKTDRKRPVILIAPTWGKNCLLETCIGEIVAALKNTNYEVYVRPHPEFVKRRGKVIRKLQKSLNGLQNIHLELDLVSGVNVHNADILITDWSGIAFEFALGTERPVIFIDTPLKVDNPKYQELGMEPLEVFSRGELGKAITISEIPKLQQVIDSFIDDDQSYRQRIINFRNRYIYNWLSSTAIGADKIIELCRKDF